MILLKKCGNSFTVEARSTQRLAEESRTDISRLFSARLRGLCVSAVSFCSCSDAQAIRFAQGDA